MARAWISSISRFGMRYLWEIAVCGNYFAARPDVRFDLLYLSSGATRDVGRGSPRLSSLVLDLSIRRRGDGEVHDRIALLISYQRLGLCDLSPPAVESIPRRILSSLSWTGAP